jgi:hypothetical protein
VGWKRKAWEAKVPRKWRVLRNKKYLGHFQPYIKTFLFQQLALSAQQARCQVLLNESASLIATTNRQHSQLSTGQL